VPLLLLAFLAFIGLGLPDPLPGSLWPELRPHFGVGNAALGLVLAAGAAGYIAAGLLAGRLIAALGIGGLLVASLTATAFTALGQALAPPWFLFVGLAVLGGMGGGAVDAALNLFAAHRFRPRHMNWLHGCWGIGATLGPAGAALLLAAGFGWQAGYLAVGLALAALALAFMATRRRWDDGAHQAHGPSLSAVAVLANPVARLQIVIFFLYTGVEASAGQWAATVLTGARGATPAEGAAAATTFFAALTAGRIGLGFVVDRVGADRLLRVLTPFAAVAALLFASGHADFIAIGLMAVALAPIYPTIMAQTPTRLGAAAAMHAVGFQVAAAMLGVAVLPAALGVAADLAGPGIVPWLLGVGAAMLAVLVWRLPVAAAQK
jgi:fucose permease